MLHRHSPANLKMSEAFIKAVAPVAPPAGEASPDPRFKLCAAGLPAASAVASKYLPLCFESSREDVVVDVRHVAYGRKRGLRWKFITFLSFSLSFTCLFVC
jgi:hypothetical protein